MTELGELIARLEKASGPDRELDAEIARAIGAEVWSISLGEYIGAVNWRKHREINPSDYEGFTLAELEASEPESWRERRAGQEAYALPRYSSSIDAALTLVPDGRDWFLAFGRERDGEPLGAAQIISKDDADHVIAEAEASTVPLAICISALKARSQQ